MAAAAPHLTRAGRADASAESAGPHPRLWGKARQVRAAGAAGALWSLHGGRRKTEWRVPGKGLPAATAATPRSARRGGEDASGTVTVGRLQRCSGPHAACSRPPRPHVHPPPPLTAGARFGETTSTAPAPQLRPLPALAVAGGQRQDSWPRPNEPQPPPAPRPSCSAPFPRPLRPAGPAPEKSEKRGRSPPSPPQPPTRFKALAAQLRLRSPRAERCGLPSTGS